MDLGAISARQSAPTDGRDASGNIVDANVCALTSKQNSDTRGMFYQCGRKDPFTFITNSELRGVTQYEYGKYPVKIYTIDGVLIYQETDGSSNKYKQPVGGTITTPAGATSMMETIKNPILFYGTWEFINQGGHTKSLWDYYWTSYSRGTDGLCSWFDYVIRNYKWHNNYLDGYVSQRTKSIYDPCPHGFRVSSNGSYNDFHSESWINHSYLSGAKWNDIWYPTSGYRALTHGFVGRSVNIQSATAGDQYKQYKAVIFASDQNLVNNIQYNRSEGASVRCIEDCDPQSDASPMSIFRFKSQCLWCFVIPAPFEDGSGFNVN